MPRLHTVIAALVGLAVLAHAAPGVAQQRERKVIVLDEIEICCQIQKPQAAFVLQRSRVRALPAGTPPPVAALVERAQRGEAGALDALVSALEQAAEFPGRRLLLGQFELDRADLALEAERDPNPHTKAAIAHLEAELTAHPGRPNIDLAYHLLGVTLLDAGRPAEAIVAFEGLLRTTPDSALTADAWFRLGEVYFDEGALEKAVEAYTRASGATEPHFRTMALYKLAWTHYRREAWDDALRGFLAVLGPPDAQPDLRSEAVEYIAITLAEDAADGDASRPRPLRHLATFLPPTDPRTPEIALALGRTLVEVTRYDLAAETLEFLLAAWPLDRTAPSASRLLMQSHHATRRFPQLIDTMERHLQRFDAGSPWATRNRGDAETLQQLTAELPAMRLQLVEALLVEAQSELDQDPPVASTVAGLLERAGRHLERCPSGAEDVQRLHDALQVLRERALRLR